MHSETTLQPQVWHVSISGMHCKGCAERIQAALLALDGVETAQVSLMPPQATLVAQSPLSLEQINQALARIGDYRAEHLQSCATSAATVPFTLPVLEAVPNVPSATSKVFWQDARTWQRASLNTLNCLIGCSIGDFGFLIYAQATALAWSIWAIMGVAMLCGLLTSVIMETVLLKVREKFDWRTALQTALSMSFLSMLAMELAENLTDYWLTGGMAMPNEPFFWMALLLSLAAGFLVPLPYNYYKLRKYNKACH